MSIAGRPEELHVLYRGCDIRLSRDEALGGADVLEYSIFRSEDMWEVASGVEETTASLNEWVPTAKAIVDDAIANPESYGDPNFDEPDAGGQAPPDAPKEQWAWWTDGSSAAAGPFDSIDAAIQDARDQFSNLKGIRVSLGRVRYYTPADYLMSMDDFLEHIEVACHEETGREEPLVQLRHRAAAEAAFKRMASAWLEAWSENREPAWWAQEDDCYIEEDLEDDDAEDE